MCIGHQRPEANHRNRFKGPWSIPSQGLPSSVVNVMVSPQFMMLSGTIVIEYPAST